MILVPRLETTNLDKSLKIKQLPLVNKKWRHSSTNVSEMMGLSTDNDGYSSYYNFLNSSNNNKYSKVSSSGNEYNFNTRNSFSQEPRVPIPVRDPTFFTSNNSKVDLRRASYRNF